MKILVAGGAGYVGSVLVPVLLEHGYEVDVVDLCWFGDYLPTAVTVVKKDIFECTRGGLKDYDQVIFLGGISNDPMAEFDPASNFKLNAALPAYLAFEAKNAGVKRFIYASTCSVYGYTVDELYDEEAPITCEYPYGISKLQGELGVFRMQFGDMSIIALRKGTICGHSPRMRFDLIVNTMFKNALVNGEIVVNNPSIWRPILDIRDAVAAYLRAIQADYSISGVFNIASDNYTVGQVGDLVCQELSRLTGRQIKLTINNMHDLRNYKVYIDKAKTKLGFMPQYNVQSIIEDLWLNYIDYGNMNEEKYYNVEVFKQIRKG
jgi:nucleoside-diphosphate-sugar epimerase